jgi:hypothetical protein
MAVGSSSDLTGGSKSNDDPAAPRPLLLGDHEHALLPVRAGRSHHHGFLSVPGASARAENRRNVKRASAPD